MALLHTCTCTRRQLLTGAAVLACSPVALAGALASGGEAQRARHFMSQAFAMKARAVASGDQSYGAVLVRGDKIIGWGPSRVVLDNNQDAHAERVAMWDAQKRAGSKDLSGSTLYSTSIPCGFCQDYAARWKVARMIHGNALADAGAPRRL